MSAKRRNPRWFKVVINAQTGTPVLVAPADTPDDRLIAYDPKWEVVLVVREVTPPKPKRGKR